MGSVKLDITTKQEKSYELNDHCDDCVGNHVVTIVDYLTTCDLCKAVKCFHCDELAGKCATCDRATCGNCKPGEYSLSALLFLNIIYLTLIAIPLLFSGQWFTVQLVTSNTAMIVKAFTFVLILVALLKTVGIVSTYSDQVVVKTELLTVIAIRSLMKMHHIVPDISFTRFVDRERVLFVKIAMKKFRNGKRPLVITRNETHIVVAIGGVNQTVLVVENTLPEFS